MESIIKQSKITFSLNDDDIKTDVKVYKNSPNCNTVIEFQLDGVHHHFLKPELERLLKVLTSINNSL
jgi:hypothetical protein